MLTFVFSVSVLFRKARSTITKNIWQRSSSGRQKDVGRKAGAVTPTTSTKVAR